MASMAPDHASFVKIWSIWAAEGVMTRIEGRVAVLVWLVSDM